jgi:drug/metabolite transporter (DMT)-like permease
LEDILANLTSPELSVTAVALRQRVTPRYVQMLLEGEGTTFSEFVLNRVWAAFRRLESLMVLVSKSHGPMLALSSAALFGASTPFAKVLVGDLHPALLAAILYLGSGIGLLVVRSTRRILHITSSPASEHLGAAGVLWLGAAILFGGVLGPLLLMFGLTLTPAASASLLLNMEGVLTALLAWFVFRENFDSRIALGMASIVAGAVVLSWQGDASASNLLGPLAVVGACLAWAIDNNFTRKVSLSDPVQIAMLKGLVAGTVNLAVAILLGTALPVPGAVAAAALLGFLGYGLSLVLFVLALREIGTARTAAYYSTAPFIGAALAFIALREPVTSAWVISGLLMSFGVWLHLTERHEHEHEHEPLVHTHTHVHDEHHRHEHQPSDPPGEPHSHKHVHVRLQHNHPHFPDMHHHHSH